LRLVMVNLAGGPKVSEIFLFSRSVNRDKPQAIETIKVVISRQWT
jgi:hypothetical protein